MTDLQHRKAATDFATKWKGKGYEKGDSQIFWLTLLRDVLGVSKPENLIQFEEQVIIDRTSFIDARIPSTGVLIEQKSINKKLDDPIRQSDGTKLTPLQQAKRYSAELPYSDRPRWIIICNFAEFHIYDMEQPHSKPEIIKLEELPKEWYRLQILTDGQTTNIAHQTTISITAGNLVGELYKLLLNSYIEPNSAHTFKELNKLCVRLVFCLYAEDTDLLGKHNAFHDYLLTYAQRPADFRKALLDLFAVLDTPFEQRDPYMDEILAKFPYINGGLFSGSVEIPFLTQKFIDTLLNKASLECDWSGISPTIFGAVFESTLNPDTRHSAGMHYTSIENIHKVIDPLFLNDLRNELTRAKREIMPSRRTTRLKNFRKHLASITFLDPACGSGNFLTETYISLRRLENEAIRAEGTRYTELNLGEEFSPISVSPSQFYGIEINDFAVSVAQTALWIAESQMMAETADIVGMPLDFLPLKNYHHIIEGNALTIDWNSVIPTSQLSYIIGNPPFIGAMMMSSKQRAELETVWGNVRGVGEFDYVTAWYKKAYDYMQNSDVRCAFVSTNSICQGQLASTLWKPLTNLNRIFAYKSFIWDSESNTKAHVHCVVIGFSVGNVSNQKFIFECDNIIPVNNISPYLADSPDVFIENRSTPICNVPHMSFGSMPRDGGFLILTEEERTEFIKQESQTENWIKKYIGAREFINGETRWCLWLKDVSPKDIRKSKLVMNRVEQVKKFRLESKALATRKFAETPILFCQIAQPDTDYLLVPAVSSERRKYIPIGFMSKDVIASNLVQIIPKASLYHFGILTSSVHMVWMRTVAGRLKSDYRYSKDIVYNNFPWPKETDSSCQQITTAAQEILDARTNHSESSLADLYDDCLMPSDLRKAHNKCDRLVLAAYGLTPTADENMIINHLLNLYNQLKT